MSELSINDPARAVEAISAAPRVTFIVGTGRSGTTFLSHALASDKRFWNSFENRYIWNYGQDNRSSDVRTASDVTPKIAAFIKSNILRFGEDGARTVIDKTPSNSLRLPFLAEIFPNEKIIHIIRDPRAVIISRLHELSPKQDDLLVTERSDSSAQASQEPQFDARRHMLKVLKNRITRGNIPINRIPAFMLDALPRYAGYFLFGRRTSFGERLAGLNEIQRVHGQLVAQAVQWRECVTHACSYGRPLGPSRYMELRYENLQSNWRTEHRRIEQFLGMGPLPAVGDYFEAKLRPPSKKDWRDVLSAHDVAKLEAFLRPTLEYLGYQ